MWASIKLALVPTTRYKNGPVSWSVTLILMPLQKGNIAAGSTRNFVERKGRLPNLFLIEQG